jgi:hypothetical protein
MKLIVVIALLSLVACKKESKDETSDKSEKSEKAGKSKQGDDDDEDKPKKKKKSDDDDGDKKPAKKGDGCTLLTQKEAEDILGYAPKLEQDEEGKTCSINPQSDKPAPFLGSITKHEYNETMWGMAKAKGEAIDDLGDKAMYSGLGLFVKKGDALLQIVIIGMGKTKEQSKKVQIELGKTALSHMK